MVKKKLTMLNGLRWAMLCTSAVTLWGLGACECSKSSKLRRRADSTTPKVTYCRIEVLNLEGRPVAGADIRYPFSKGAKVRQSDAQGKIQLKLLPSAEHFAHISAEGMAPTVLSLSGQQCKELRKVKLEPGMSFRGTILNDQGKVISQAKIKANPPGIPFDKVTLTQTTTNASGQFVLSNLAPSGVDLRLEARGHETTQQREWRVTAKPSTFVMSRLGSLELQIALSATVTKPPRGAEAWLAGSGVWPAKKSKFDQSGKAIFGDVPSGIYEARIVAEHFISNLQQGILVEPGKHVTLNIALQNAQPTHFKVYDALSKKALSHATVRLEDKALTFLPLSAKTNRGGRTQLWASVQQDYTARVEAKGYASQTVAIKAGSASAHDIALEPTATLLGQVLDEQGHRIQGAKVIAYGISTEDKKQSPLTPRQVEGGRLATLYPAFNQLSVTQGPIPSIHQAFLLPTSLQGQDAQTQVTTDQHGLFALHNIIPGKVVIGVQHAKFVTDETTTLSLKPAEKRKGLVIKLKKGGAIYGKVIDAAGHPLMGTFVSLTTTHQLRPIALSTDQKGEFVYSPLLGIVKVQVAIAGYNSIEHQSEVWADKKSYLTIKLPYALASFDGQVLGANGMGVAGAKIKLFSALTRLQYRADSNQQGYFSFAGLAPAPYDLEISAEGYAKLRYRSWSPSGRTNLFHLRGGIGVEGTVVDRWLRTSLKSARVDAYDGKNNLVDSVVGGRDGKFRLDGLTPGIYRLRVSAPGFGYFEQQFVLPPHADKAINVGRIELERAGQIEGTVVDSLGRPVPNAEVGGAGNSTSTSSEGNFVLRGLPSGQHTLWASHRLAGKAYSDPVRVLENQTTPNVVIHLPSRKD